MAAIDMSVPDSSSYCIEDDERTSVTDDESHLSLPPIKPRRQGRMINSTGPSLSPAKRAALLIEKYGSEPTRVSEEKLIEISSADFRLWIEEIRFNATIQKKTGDITHPEYKRIIEACQITTAQRRKTLNRHSAAHSRKRVAARISALEAEVIRLKEVNNTLMLSKTYLEDCIWAIGAHELVDRLAISKLLRQQQQQHPDCGHQVADIPMPDSPINKRYRQYRSRSRAEINPVVATFLTSMSAESSLPHHWNDTETPTSMSMLPPAPIPDLFVDNIEPPSRSATYHNSSDELLDIESLIGGC